MKRGPRPADDDEAARRQRVVPSPILLERTPRRVPRKAVGLQHDGRSCELEVEPAHAARAGEVAEALRAELDVVAGFLGLERVTATGRGDLPLAP